MLPFFFLLVAVSGQGWLPSFHQEVMFLREYSIPIPEDVAEKVQTLSQHMGIRMEAVVLFAVLRFLEIQNWVLKLWR